MFWRTIQALTFKMLAEVAITIQYSPFSDGELQDITRERIVKNLVSELPCTDSGLLAQVRQTDPEKNLEHFLHHSICLRTCSPCQSFLEIFPHLRMSLKNPKILSGYCHVIFFSTWKTSQTKATRARPHKKWFLNNCTVYCYRIIMALIAEVRGDFLWFHRYEKVNPVHLHHQLFLLLLVNTDAWSTVSCFDF